MTRTSLMASFLPLSLCAALVGCAAEVDGLGEDDELPDELVDGKADSLTSPTLRGELLFGRTAVLDYDKDFRNLAVDFSLSAKATVDLTTFAFDKADDSAPVALYLYKKSAAGVWRKQVRTAERYTELSKELSAGTYRVIVRGLTSTASGRAALASACTGSGCPSTECVFGSKIGASLENLPAGYFRSATYSATSNLLALKELDGGLVRRAYAEATGRDPSTLSDDDLLAELDVAPTITVMNDDGMKQYVAATLNFKSGEIHTLVIDISEEEGSALELPAARAYEFAIAATSSNTAKASSCSVAPPICLGLAHKSRFTSVSNQVWSSAAEVPADKVAVVVQSLFPFTQETDLTASMNALGGQVAEIVESFKPAGTLPTPFEVTYYGGAVDDISYLSAFAGGQRSFVGYDGGAYRCLHFVPAINAQPAAE